MAAAWIAGAVIFTVGAIIGHHTQVDPSGNLLVLDNAGHSPAWWNVVTDTIFPLVAACWLGSLAGQVLSYRRSSRDRRQQLKWLMSGSVIAGLGGAIGIMSGHGQPFGIVRILAADPWPSR